MRPGPNLLNLEYIRKGKIYVASPRGGSYPLSMADGET